MPTKNQVIRTATLPETGFLKLPQIIGQPEITEAEAERNRREATEQKRRGEKQNWKPKRSRPKVVGPIPVSKTTWWGGVAEGKFPAPIKLGSRCTVWRVEDIRTLINQAAGGAK